MQITSVLLASVIGKCSLIFCVVLPCIVVYKYVYGVFPNGVSNPINAHIIIINIKNLTLSFLFIFILYGFLFSSSLFIFILETLLVISCNFLFNSFTLSWLSE